MAKDDKLENIYEPTEKESVKELGSIDNIIPEKQEVVLGSIDNIKSELNKLEPTSLYPKTNPRTITDLGNINK